MPSARDSAETTNAAGERHSLIRRICALPGRTIALAQHKPLLFAVLLCGTSVIVGSGISALVYLGTHGTASGRDVSINAALKLLDAGDLDAAKQMAHQLRLKVGDDYRRLSYPLFVQGAVLAQEAKQLGYENERRTMYLVAARYLEESRSRGFPPDREKEGLFLLGTSLYNADQFAESLPVLREALEKLPNQQYELARLLSSAYMRDNKPNLKQALRFNHVWLSNPALSATDRDLALLQQAEILLDQHDILACHDALAHIEEDSIYHGQALVLQARLAIEEGDELVAGEKNSGAADAESRDKFRQAIGALQGAQSADDPSGTITRQSQYLLGICHQKLGDLRAANTAFERTLRGHYGTSEALAATLAEAEIAQQQGRTEIALALFYKVIEEAGLPSLYHNRWVPLGELHGRLSGDQQRFVTTHDFDAALKLADAFDPLFPVDKCAAAKAATHEAWAEHLLERADTMPHIAAEVTRAEARQQFRQAGDQYRTLAKLRFATDAYPTDLWKSGNCFLRGQNYLLAIELLRSHLDNIPRKQAPLGLVNLGECHLALGRYHTAINVLNECIKFFPKHPESYRARILASIAYRETGALDEAQALLIDNLHNSSLTPRSRYWQESLLDYGKLLFQQAHALEAESYRLMKENTSATATLDQRKSGFEELKQSHDLFQNAIATLEESVMREEKAALDDGRDPESSEARYYIAEAYRHSANLPKRSVEIEPTQTRRNTLRQQMRSYLQDATRAHRELQDQLARKQNHTELSPVDQRILRNTYFAHADTLFDLDEYDQAISAYTTATNRYQHEPEAVEALLRIASCYRRLNLPAEAKGTMLQADSVLDRIRKDADFTKTTRYNREEWKQLINWLAKL